MLMLFSLHKVKEFSPTMQANRIFVILSYIMEFWLFVVDLKLLFELHISTSSKREVKVCCISN